MTDFANLVVDINCISFFLHKPQSVLNTDTTESLRKLALRKQYEKIKILPQTYQNSQYDQKKKNLYFSASNFNILPPQEVRKTEIPNLHNQNSLPNTKHSFFLLLFPQKEER